MLASLGPVFAFFVASTDSYPFLLLLHVLFSAIGGFISLHVLRRAADVMFRDGEAKRQQKSQRLLTVWCLLYGTVGAQMGWLLRPFLGAPGYPVEFLRPNAFEGNAWVVLIRHFARLGR